jgi:hypothetical protein
MPYIIQAEEQDISNDLLQQLAAVLAELPELILADAIHRIHNCHGLLVVEDKIQALHISQRFTELGFPNFILEELLALPKPERLNLEKPEAAEKFDLAVAARVQITEQSTDHEYRMTGIGLAAVGLGIPRLRIEEKTVEHTDTHFFLDLFTSESHWRAQADVTLRIKTFLEKLNNPTVHLDRGADSLMKGETNLPTFRKAADYERYLSWQYQLRYVKR